MAKPVIGINCDLDISGAGRPRPRGYLLLYTNYFDAVIQAGGLPLLIPFLEDEADINQALTKVDAVLLTGGDDINPSFYDAPSHPDTKMAPPRRQQFDLILVKAVLARQMPVMGICMGMQMLNVAGGGTLQQEIKGNGSDSIEHRQVQNDDREVHEVNITPGSALAEIVQDNSLTVNSTHHHAVDAVAPGFKISGRASDGTIEAIEREGKVFVLGVQWHPERLIDNPRHLNLFKALIEQV